MKKYFAIIALASLTLVACEKVQEFFDDSDDVTTIYAIAGANNTKTTVNGLNVLWSSGDVVAVANENDEIVEFTLKGGAGSNEASFEGTLGGKELGDYAVYPFTANSAVEGNSVTVDYLTTWAYGETVLPMWGKRVSEYSFYNVGGAVLVTYSNVPATTNGKHFVFTSNKNITGTVTVSNLGGTPAVSTPAGGNTVTITGIPSDATSVSVIVPVPAGTDYNITAALYEDSTDALVPGTLKAANDRTFTRNIITKFDDVDLTPVITVTSANPMAVASTTSSQTITYAIANVAASEVVTASSNDAWITGLNVVNGTTVTFNVAQQPQGGAGRSGEITLSYNGASNVVVTVNQDPAPVINVTSANPMYVDEEDGGAKSISYSISNPTTATLSASTSDSWITITDDSAVSFTVAYNTDAAPRTGTITLTYDGAEDVTVTVHQEGLVFTLTASNYSTNWTAAGTTNTNPLRFGGKGKGASHEGSLISNSGLFNDYNISRIIVTSGAKSGSGTIDNLTISAYTTLDEDPIGSVSNNDNVPSSSLTLTNADATNGTSWNGKYYKIIYSITSAKPQEITYIQFTDAKFYGYDEP